MAVFCTKCGESMDSEDRFCRHCGAPRPSNAASRFGPLTPPPSEPSGYWHGYVRPFFLTAALFIGGLCAFFLMLKLVWVLFAWD